MNKVIIVLSPNKNAENVPLDLLSDTVYKGGLGQGVFPLPNNLARMDKGMIYVAINPNSAELNEILNLTDAKVVIQSHAIGEISRVSGDMFLTDQPEAVISNFTRQQHQYKRMLNPLEAMTGIEHTHLVETAIDSKEAIIKLWDLAKTLIGEVEVVVEEVKVEAEAPLIDFDNPEPEVDLTPMPVEEAPVPATTEEPTPVVEEPVPVEVELDLETVTAIDPDPSATQAVIAQEEFDPMASITETAKVEELPPLSEVQSPILGEDDFEKALLNSIQKADPTAVVKTTEADTAAVKTFAIPEDYPNVDHTVTFDSAKIFSDSKDEEAEALFDWGASPGRFNKLHARIGDRITRAVDLNRDPNLTDFERAVLKYGEDQVATSETHKFQYVEGARWGNTINSPTASVPIIMPIRNPNYGDAKYVGPESVSLLQNRMKIGCKLGIYLPHTGIYFIIVSPGDDQFLDTLSIINNQRVTALRSSSGILLGNSNFYINRQVINLFLDSIVHCSLGTWNKENLLELIDERDINIMADALGASIYPDGYEYVQTCGLLRTDNKICDHLTRKLIDLRRLVFVDNSRLSEAQKIHAAGALTERSLNEIKVYQEANYIGYKKAYEITEGVEFVYRAQSAKTSIEAGEKWIKEIEAIVDNIITFREDEDTRNLMIEQRISLTRIREYSHWVAEILVDGQPITERDKINKLLNSLSRKSEVVDKVSETLSEFQRLSSVAIVAVPRIPCPSCDQTSERDLDISAHLIPQDAVSRLFTLVRQRLS